MAGWAAGAVTLVEDCAIFNQLKADIAGSKKTALCRRSFLHVAIFNAGCWYLAP